MDSRLLNTPFIPNDSQQCFTEVAVTPNTWRSVYSKQCTTFQQRPLRHQRPSQHYPLRGYVSVTPMRRHISCRTHLGFPVWSFTESAIDRILLRRCNHQLSISPGRDTKERTEFSSLEWRMSQSQDKRKEMTTNACIWRYVKLIFNDEKCAIWCVLIAVWEIMATSVRASGVEIMWWLI